MAKLRKMVQDYIQLITIMIKYIKVAIILFTFIGMPVWADDVVIKPVPRISCKERIYDFGTKDNMLKVKHTFVIKNSGDADLIIKKVKTTCGCTVAKFSDKTIGPGETADLNAVFTLRNRHGRQQKSIKVTSNDPKQPDFVLCLKGNAVSELEIRPKSIYFKQQSQTKTALRTVEIISKKPLNITNVTSSTEFFLPSIESIKSNNVYKLTVALVPPIPQGYTRGTIRLKNNGTDIIVNVSVLCTGVLSFAPKRVIIRPPTNPPAAYYIVVRSDGKVDFKVLSVDLPDEKMKYTITAFGKHGYRIKLADLSYDKKFDGKMIIIKTDIAAMPIIEVPLAVRP